MSEARLFVMGPDEEVCRNCFVPETEHVGQYQRCPIGGAASIEYAASVGAPWALRIVEQQKARQS